MTALRRFFVSVFGGALPLTVGVLGLGILVVDLFGVLPLPPSYGDEVLLASASTVLLAYYAGHRSSQESGRQAKALHTEVNTLLARVEAAGQGVRQVPPQDIRGHLERNLVGTRAFYFRGGSGTWLRRFTLPQLGSITDRDVDVSVQLLDPRDEMLCDSYARYRAASRQPSTRRPDEDDPRVIQRDILGALYASAWYGARCRLDVEIVLLRSFSPLRHDISSQGLVTSVADLAAPGLVAPAGSWYHGAMVDELRQARHGHAVAELPGTGAFFPARLETVTGPQVQAALAATSVRSPGGNVGPLLDEFCRSGVDWDAVARAHVHA